MDTALEGLRVIDLSSGIAGPLCTKMLGDIGADVIKIESPRGGDESRRSGPFFKDDPHPEKSLLFFYLNCNKKSITLIALEEVTDPRNIGSIIRSAASFNIDGLIIKERHFPSESKLLYKSASGCMEHINLFKVSNLNTTLKFLKAKNFWTCGFDIDGKKDFTEHNWDGNNVLLFGSEGYGLKYQTKKNTDFLLKININKKIESLNISNSASVVFHYINSLNK